MRLETRIKMSISRKKSDAVLRSEFSAMGSEAQVTRALRNLVRVGFIVRIGVGVYAKAKISVISKKPIPVRPRVCPRPGSPAKIRRGGIS